MRIVAFGDVDRARYLIALERSGYGLCHRRFARLIDLLNVVFQGRVVLREFFTD